MPIINTGTNAVAMIWPSTPTSFDLQQNTDLNTTNWVSVGAVPNDDGTNNPVLAGRNREPALGVLRSHQLPVMLENDLRAVPGLQRHLRGGLDVRQPVTDE